MGGRNPPKPKSSHIYTMKNVFNFFATGPFGPGSMLRTGKDLINIARKKKIIGRK